MKRNTAPYFLLCLATSPLLLPFPATAEATIGDRSCADAGVVASISSQMWHQAYEVWPKAKSTPVSKELRINLDIEKVLFGPIAQGPAAITMMTHTKVHPSHTSVRMFLMKAPAGDWWVATCDFKF